MIDDYWNWFVFYDIHEERYLDITILIHYHIDLLYYFHRFILLIF